MKTIKKEERKNETSKIRGGGICDPRAKHGIVPLNLSYDIATSIKSYITYLMTERSN